MKTLLGLWLLTSYAFAQEPVPTFRRDTVLSVSSPDAMPVTRSANSFYRYEVSSSRIMRATTDNMPVSLSDSSVRYTMEQRYRRAPEAPSSIQPRLRVTPKRFR